MRCTKSWFWQRTQTMGAGTVTYLTKTFVFREQKCGDWEVWFFNYNDTMVIHTLKDTLVIDISDTTEPIVINDRWLINDTSSLMYLSLTWSAMISINVVNHIPAMFPPPIRSFTPKADRALTGKILLLSTPSILFALSATKLLTSSISWSLDKMSTLFKTNTIFLPHCLMYLRNLVSLSVKGLSASTWTPWVKT